MKGQKSGNKLLAGSLKLPQDVCLGETILTFMGRSVLRIENYRGILRFTDTSVMIQAKYYKLLITGKRLTIRYYDKDEMEIRGQIKAVSFE